MLGWRNVSDLSKPSYRHPQKKARTSRALRMKGKSPCAIAASRDFSLDRNVRLKQDKPPDAPSDQNPFSVVGAFRGGLFVFSSDVSQRLLRD
jgi:hypothetical protein